MVRLTFTDPAPELSGYARSGSGRTPFGTVQLGRSGEHEVLVCGDGVPTVTVDDVLLPDGGTRVLRPPGRIAVDDATGTVSQRGGLRLTRAAKAVTAEVAGRTYVVRMEGLNLVTVVRAGHGRVAAERAPRGFALEARADATDLAVALALTDAVERDVLALLPTR